MVFFKKEKENFQIEWKIKRKCLDLIFECAKSNYPKEFGAMLRVDEDEKDTITELVLLPGTISGDSHAIFKLHMQPIDFSIVGTVHSHPSSSPNPSDADLRLFGKHGKIHIIVASPYDDYSWKGYTYNGEEINIKVI